MYQAPGKTQCFLLFKAIKRKVSLYIIVIVSNDTEELPHLHQLEDKARNIKF